MDTNDVMTRQELRDFLGVKHLRLRKLISQGLPFVRIDFERNRYLFLRKSVVRWLESLEQNSLPKPPTPEKKDEKPKLVGMG